MPLLSIIVPVYGVQGYLRECLESILNQSFTDFELIGVDDASPDHSGRILDEYAARDARVRVLHLAHNVGLGLARNAGLDQATGEYVWFVDSDDWLPVGAVRAVAARLRQARPDLLLVDHTRVSWLGEHTPSDGTPVLARVEAAGVVGLRDEPGLLNLFTVAWNKVVRREFLLGSEIRFDVGWYEDLPFTFPLLVAADRIAALGRVCYHYRRRRRDAITHTRSARHAEVFEQWDRVFARLDRLGERAEPYRRLVHGRMVWHLLIVANHADRLPRASRRAFFHRIAEAYHRHLPAGSPGPRSVRERLVATGNYRAFTALRRVHLAGQAARRRGRTLAGRAFGFAWAMAGNARALVGRLLYHAMRRLPVDGNLAVFAAYWYRGYACNPAAVHARLSELAPDLRTLWIVDRAHRNEVPPGVPRVVVGTVAYYRSLARARWLVNNVNFPDFVVKRPGTVHLQTHHGTPVKVMGLDQGAFPVGAQGLELNGLMRRSDRWDFSLSANPHSTEVWDRAYPCGYTTLEYGYPRNDRLARADPAAVAAARSLLDISPEVRVVLYAPTHREYVPGFQPLLDLEEFAETLGDNTLVLVRAHYFYASPQGPPGLRHPRVRDVSAHPCVEDVLLATDVLVTDYSSMMFDFAVLDRPIAIYAPDWDAYARTRGVTFDLLAEPPGVVATSPADLADAFRTGAVWGDPATKIRAQFRARFCALEDGHAAERVARRVFAEAIHS